MRDKLIELLLQIEGLICTGCGNRPAETTAKHIADHLIANGVTFATDNNVPCKWIPIKERLPEHSGLVLVYGIGEPEIMNFDYLDKTWHGTRCRRITHWMPLPEPPKEGE